jgi:uncharacterized cupredoxin-like copper-binding protein
MRFAILFGVVAALVLAACSSAPTSTEVVVKSTADGFSPVSAIVEAGQPFQLTLDNTSSTEHQLAIKEIPTVSSGGSGRLHDMDAMGDTTSNMEEMNMYQVHMIAQAGERVSVKMTPSKPGQYEFVCMEPGHTERGTLIVK